MNILIKADNWLLDISKRVARAIYLWIGIDNFKIGECCALIGVWIRVYVLGVSIQSQYHILFFVDLALVIAALIFLFSERPTCIPNMYNPFRFILRKFRIMYLGLMTVLIFSFLDSDTMLLSSLRIISIVFSFAFPFYLFSIEPEPPSQSKLGKLFEKMKSSLLRRPVLDSA